MGRAAAIITFGIGGLIVADLWAHYRTTARVLEFAGSESRLLAGK